MTALYLVGGAVRDHLMGKEPKDWDFAVETGSFDEMRVWLSENDFEIFLETPQYLTIRARRKDPWAFAGFNMTGRTFDFVLCRKDGAYSDGRRPDEVTAGTIFDDLARRDFTMNAIAIDREGNLIDPFHGHQDIQTELIRCVGGIERLKEDGLRILRAIRFYVQTGFDMHGTIDDFLGSMGCVDYLKPVSQDRIRDEVHKAFKHNTVWAVRTFSEYPYILDAVFEETGIWLEPTSKQK